MLISIAVTGHPVNLHFLIFGRIISDLNSTNNAEPYIFCDTRLFVDFSSCDLVVCLIDNPTIASSNRCLLHNNERPFKLTANKDNSCLSFRLGKFSASAYWKTIQSLIQSDLILEGYCNVIFFIIAHVHMHCKYILTCIAYRRLSPSD